MEHEHPAIGTPQDTIYQVLTPEASHMNSGMDTCLIRLHFLVYIVLNTIL